MSRQTNLHDRANAVLCEDTSGELGAAVGLALIPSVRREHGHSRRPT